MTELEHDLVIISTNCKTTADSIGQAYQLIEQGEHIVKIANQKLSTVVIRRIDGSCGILADLLFNFRNLNGQPVGYLDTNVGAVGIPKFWPAKPLVLEKYGLPHREEYDDLLVDVFVVNSYWSKKIATQITELPIYKTTGFD